MFPNNLLFKKELNYSKSYEIDFGITMLVQFKCISYLKRETRKYKNWLNEKVLSRFMFEIYFLNYSCNFWEKNMITTSRLNFFENMTQPQNNWSGTLLYSSKDTQKNIKKNQVFSFNTTLSSHLSKLLEYIILSRETLAQCQKLVNVAGYPNTPFDLFLFLLVCCFDMKRGPLVQNAFLLLWKWKGKEFMEALLSISHLKGLESLNPFYF